MNSSSIMFLFFVLFSPLVSILLNDWIFSWGMMEVSMICLFPLLLSDSSKESMLKYFLIQSLASMFMLISGVLYFNLYEQEYIFYILFLMSLSLKIGFFPGHFWVPSVMSSVGMISMMLLLGPMKFIPLAFFNLSFQILDKILFTVLILAVFSTIVGAILGNNQTSIRSMLGSSSISHSGWMMVAMCYNWLWMYFFSYLLILMFFCVSFFYQQYFSMMINIVSLSGIPPFLVFILKMKVLMFLSSSMEYLMFVVLILSSIFSLVFYLKFFYSFLLMSKNYNYFSILVFSLLNVLGIFVLF
uniref:NADH-ubiquinone oxidoreductase chain 2 n=1 Tax=Laevapex fuscus TaxID=240816 RepID=A0A8F8AGX4_9GAST|nr:NADH dehydrogenase subunit 2 [Laevapex fuscus]